MKDGQYKEQILDRLERLLDTAFNNDGHDRDVLESIYELFHSAQPPQTTNRMKEDIVKELSEQIEECRISSGMQSTSWGNQCGVLISGDMAKEIIALLKELPLSQLRGGEFTSEDIHIAINMARGITVKGDMTHSFHHSNIEIVNHIQSNKSPSPAKSVEDFDSQPWAVYHPNYDSGTGRFKDTPAINMKEAKRLLSELVFGQMKDSNLSKIKEKRKLLMEFVDTLYASQFKK